VIHRIKKDGIIVVEWLSLGAGRSQDFWFGGKFLLKFEPKFFEAKKQIPPSADSFNWSNIIFK